MVLCKDCNTVNKADKSFCKKCNKSLKDIKDYKHSELISSRNKKEEHFLDKLDILLAVGLIFSFFLPWIKADIISSSQTLTGQEVSQLILEGNILNLSQAAGYLLHLLPVLSLLIIISRLIDYELELLKFSVALIAVLQFVIFDNSRLIGIYLTMLLGSIMMTVVLARAFSRLTEGKGYLKELISKLN